MSGPDDLRPMRLVQESIFEMGANCSFCKAAINFSVYGILVEYNGGGPV